MLYLYMYVCVTIVVIIFGAVARGSIGGRVVTSIVIVLFGFYIVFDVQMIVGGKHRQFQFAVDDYVFAALCLCKYYIYIYMYIM